jgi:hypothetical protein
MTGGVFAGVKMLIPNRSWLIGASEDWRFKAIIKLKSDFSGSEQTATELLMVK